MLLWFRNDLRVQDNPALAYALENGATSAIFFVSEKQWRIHHWSDIKIDFILRHAELLKSQLETLGIALNIVTADAFFDQVNYLTEHFAGQTLVVNEELELNEKLRDSQLVDAGFNLVSFESDVIVPKGRVLNKSGEMFKVFTPFKRAWLSFVRQNGFEFIDSPKIHEEFSHLAPSEGSTASKSSSKWPLANEFTQDVLPNFMRFKLAGYADSRDIPSVKGTSGISAYLAIGAISPRYLLVLLLNQHPDLLSEQPANCFSWLNELIWREFYRHLLFHFPDLIKGGDFNEKYKQLPWPNDKAKLDAWQQGKTGYPIVDAAMNQLNQTGWMHNRLRMIVASFLTKHLLVDWRLGEEYFAKRLIDYDFSANNGGWQWSAGTGCDAQPYFRIFNPLTQSQKFDPTGKFIRKYLPELAGVPDKYIHFPHEYLKREGQSNIYWPALVEHKTAREEALAFYKQYL